MSEGEHLSPIRNRVDESGLTTLDLGRLIPAQPIVPFDLEQHLEMGLVLREKAFRSAIDALHAADWEGQHVALHCSSDAVIPDWAWMLATSKLTQFGAAVWVGTPDQVNEMRVIDAIDRIELKDYEDARVVIKGCASGTTATSLARVIQKLQPAVRSIFYGEPCSTVPVYKRPAKSP